MSQMKAFAAIRQVCGEETCNDLNTLLILVQYLPTAHRDAAIHIIEKTRTTTGKLRMALAAMLQEEKTILTKQLQEKINDKA